MAILRKKIDDTDNHILMLLAKRFMIVRELKELKEQHGIIILQLSRRNDLLKKRKMKAKDLNLSQKMIERIWNTIHTYSLLLQED